ncbi:ankyrin repeat-containing domain protein [Podospora australis]|uniref:Ankyrin repeat-containing domain protein n=1 Tax=Podospora australis TaxID=1536484 RepID=A0AAN7AEA4_9PEZI|nr:ankyrin repeat-containing domain protein [Podospora australis]
MTEDVNAQNHNGDTPLHIAVKAGDVDIATHLMENAGASAAINDNNGSIDITELVLQSAPHLIEHRVHGSTALHHAILAGGHYMIRVLIEHGADVNAPAYIGTDIEE